LNGNGVVVGIALDANLRGSDLGRIRICFCRDAEESFLITGIGAVGDEFSEKDVSIGIEGIDDNVHDFANFGLESVLDVGCWSEAAVLVHRVVVSDIQHPRGEWMDTNGIESRVTTDDDMWTFGSNPQSAIRKL
jgi:hypothetical protein